MSIIRPIARIALRSGPQSLGLHARSFATSKTARASNQVFDSVRRPQDLHTYQLLASSARTPLLTLWTASYCGTCKTVAPLLRSLVEAGTGESDGGVAYCEVEFDAPDIMAGGADINGLALGNMVTAIPTLLSFDAENPSLETRVTDARRLADRAFLEEWIRSEARRIGRGGGGSGGGLFGGLFKSLR